MAITEAETRRGGTAQALWPLLRAVMWAAIGYLAAAAAVLVIQGQREFTEAAIVLGFPFGVAGWLLGVGGWEAILRPFFGGRAGWDEGDGFGRYLRLSTDHKVIGIQYLVAATTTFFLGGLAAMLMRAELASPPVDFFADAQQYNAFMGVHGTLMMFGVAVVAIASGLGHYFVPLLIGADRMVFPRLEGISFWFIPVGVVSVLVSPFVGGLQSGWTAYQPLAAADPAGQLFYYLGVIAFVTSSMLTAINVLGTIVHLRAPGLTWRRLPIFGWGLLTTSILNFLWVPVVAVAMILAILDRVVPTSFFRPPGDPLLWQDLFWLFGHPEVYIIVLPAFALWLEIIPVFARKTLFAYRWAVAGFLGITLLSSFVWTHHMFVTVPDARLIPFMANTELISIPTGLMFLAAFGTLWRGRLRLRAPLVLVLMSIFNFVLGGVSGTFLADVPANFYEHDTFFVVSHFHYTIVGGMVFAWLAGMYYWLPKMSGRMYSERWAQAAAWVTFVGFNGAFLLMFLVGLNGMNRRVAGYPDYLGDTNLAISVFAWILGLGFLMHLVIIVWSWARGRRAGPNPWGGRTLEWQTSSPPPQESFEQIPEVTEDFYGYGRAGPEPDMLRLPGAGALDGDRGRPRRPSEERV